MKLILVFGISGVGKTTLCTGIVRDKPGIFRFSASELLRSATNETSEYLRTSSPDQISENQNLIRQQLLARVPDDYDGIVLLEAHSVIDNGKQLVRIPEGIISDLLPNRLVFLEAEPSLIATRRQLQGEGRGEIRSVDEISRHQKLAIEQASLYSDMLGIKLERIKVDDQIDARSVLTF